MILGEEEEQNVYSWTGQYTTLLYLMIHLGVCNLDEK